jgi:hypothetical protein
MTNPHDKTRELPAVDEGRRKLTKAGLAAPAVLGTLASRPVLAGVPWKCTISGQVSGNVSGHANESCTTLGDSHATLKGTYASLPDTLSTKFPGLTVYFHWNSGTLTTSNSDPEATIGQILNNTPPAGLEYAQKAVVILLNAKSIADPNVYPVTESQAKNLYIAAATNSGYTDTNVNWDNMAVRSYIDLLYH